ncbi:MAG: tetratricopeptide repeat protein, partial [Bacteroidota bacterium]
VPHYKFAVKSELFGNEAKANLAYCYLVLKKTRKAKRLFKELVDIFQNNYKIQYNMALCYSRLKKREKALIYLNRAANLESGFGGIYLTRGHIHLIMGNKELAKKDLERAKSLGSSQSDKLMKRL